MDHTSQWCPDTKECLVALKANPQIDLLITDIMMPGTNGLDFLKQLRSSFPNLKVVIMSGMVDTAIKNQAKELGAKVFLQKPFDMETLKKTVLLALEG